MRVSCQRFAMRHLRGLGLVPLFASLGLIALGPPSDAGAAASDPAARGLDLFIDMPGSSAPGGKIPVQIVALGFPTAVTLAPLAGAEIEATWGPEGLGKGGTKGPAPVTATTDASGRLHLDVPVPEGDERRLKLLLGTRIGDHHRTSEVWVDRIASRELSLIVPDSQVVPGGATSVWAIVKSMVTGEPASGEEVVFELLEGGVARHSVRATTDLAGAAMARVPIPWTDEPTFQWKLTARSRSASGADTGTGAMTLSPREETPGQPVLVAEWGDKHVMPGDPVKFALRLRDASDKPVAGAKVRYWIGPRGTDPPSIKEDPKAWERASTLAVTDMAGEVRGTTDSPKTIRKGGSTTLRIVAHSDLFGHELSAVTLVEVSAPLPVVTATPEAGQIVPGLTQTVVVSVRDARDKPVSGTFTVEADGLSQRVTTDARGQAEVSWKVPVDVGATRNVGPCAGGVAATVRVRPAAPIAAIDNRTDPFATCVPVNREIAALARADKPMVVANGTMHVSLAEAPDPKAKDAKKAAKKGKVAEAWSVRAAPNWQGGPSSVAAWVTEAEKGVDLALPSAAPGTWKISGIAPQLDRAAKVGMGHVLVSPRVVPLLSAKIAGGRAAPLGTVEIDVDLTDGKGHGAPGSVAALLVDAFGGGTTDGLLRLDTRRSQCSWLGVEREDCDAFFDDPTAETLRRQVLGQQSVNVALPDRDPGGTAKDELRDAFKSVLLSLEGAVMDATAQPDLLRDAFRKEKSAYTFNPELFTLVTDAMSPPPETPGGEPIVLADLVAVDKQVSYDNVARRVTRLKLFRVLAAVRTYRTNRQLDPDEPVLRDPNAILRRMVTAGDLQSAALLDPWGGTMSFVKAPPGERMPFINVRGFELHAPGPDGKVGTADDVKGPFERVVASGTPYAKAMDEDRLVDAALDMEVSESTVSAWQSVLEELTGQTLGDSFGAGGIGLGGGGFGSGHGIGVSYGRAGVTRRSSGISSGAAYWAPPQRTDDKGHLRLHVPLGDVETTWRLALVGAPDGATPAVTTIDIPSALPLSARVDAGSAWIQGDQADVIVTVRNRTQAAAKVELALSAGGVAELDRAAPRSRTVDVPAGGAAEVPVRVTSKGVGTATLDVFAKGPNGLEDRTSHAWEVRPAGDKMELMSTQWVADQGTIALAQVGPGLQATGTAKLTLERGNASAIEAALDSLDPDRITSMDGLSYAEEAAARIQKWAIAQRGADDPLAVRAGDVVRRSIGRLLARKERLVTVGTAPVGLGWTAQRRALRWAPPDLVSEVGKVDDCPPGGAPNIEEGLAILEAEPSSADGVIQACWDSAVASIVEDVTASRNRYALARAVIALAERPQRAAVAASLAEKLRWWVELRASGGVTLPSAITQDRKARSMVFAALLRTAALGKPGPASPDKIAAWLRVQRDARGSYGSTLATLAAVRALLQQPSEAAAVSKVRIVADGVTKELEIKDNQTIVVPLGAKVLSADLTVTGPGVIARLSRPGLRLWSSPADTSWSGIALDVQWPEKPKAGVKQVLRLVAATTLARQIATDVRIPLPPGAGLAEGGNPARQIQGQLVVHTRLDADGTSTIIELPIRFGLAGTFTVPEARARATDEEGVLTTTAARPLRITN